MPVTGLTPNFSPIPRIDPPPFGREICGSGLPNGSRADSGFACLALSTMARLFGCKTYVGFQLFMVIFNTETLHSITKRIVKTLPFLLLKARSVAKAVVLGNVRNDQLRRFGALDASAKPIDRSARSRIPCSFSTEARILVYIYLVWSGRFLPWGSF